MADDNKIVSPFRDLCLETVVRFVNHQNKCDFNENNAETFLQDGRLLWLLSCNIINELRKWNIKNKN